MPDNHANIVDRVQSYSDKQREADPGMQTFADLIDNNRAGISSSIYHPDGQKWNIHSFTHLTPVEDRYWPGEQRHETQTWYYAPDGARQLHDYEKHGCFESMERFHLRRVKAIVGGDFPEVEDDA